MQVFLFNENKVVIERYVTRFMYAMKDLYNDKYKWSPETVEEKKIVCKPVKLKI